MVIRNEIRSVIFEPFHCKRMERFHTVTSLIRIHSFCHKLRCFFPVSFWFHLNDQRNFSIYHFENLIKQRNFFVWFCKPVMFQLIIGTFRKLFVKPAHSLQCFIMKNNQSVVGCQLYIQFNAIALLYRSLKCRDGILRCFRFVIKIDRGGLSLKSPEFKKIHRPFPYSLENTSGIPDSVSKYTSTSSATFPQHISASWSTKSSGWEWFYIIKYFIPQCWQLFV